MAMTIRTRHLGTPAIVTVGMACFATLCLKAAPGRRNTVADRPATMTETIHFTTADFNAKLAADDRYGPQMTFNRSIYFVWADSQRRPMVAKIGEESGRTSIAPLDPNPDYLVTEDPHHRFSLGVDHDGYIHIAGDMHNYSYHQQAGLPERYRGGRMLYWVSTNPEDISEFAFMGHDSRRCVPGYGFTYQHFNRDNNGVLYLMTRVGGYHTRAVGLFRYDADMRTWTALGGLDRELLKERPKRPVDPDPVFLFRVPYGLGDHAYYQAYLCNLRFGYDNRMHIAITCNAVEDPEVREHTHLVYAYSDDGGHTFRRADGSLIDRLPMRVAPAAHRPSVVIENARLGFTPASPFYDRQGVPAVSVGPYWYYRPETGRWIGPTESPVQHSGWRVSSYCDPTGMITFVNGGKLYRTAGLDPALPGTQYTVEGGLTSIDDALLRKRNIFRGVSRTADRMMIKTVRFVVDDTAAE